MEDEELNNKLGLNGVNCLKLISLDEFCGVLLMLSGSSEIYTRIN